jgi:flagellar basal-body rod protein FlgC
MLGAMDISASGLVAQRIRMETVAVNIANINTAGTLEEGPFRRRSVEFKAGLDRLDRAGLGVHVSKINQEDDFRIVNMPDHPNADAHGNVKLPAINQITEMVNGMEAGRAYEANLAAMDMTKDMFANALRIIA